MPVPDRHPGKQQQHQAPCGCQVCFAFIRQPTDGTSAQRARRARQTKQADRAFRIVERCAREQKRHRGPQNAEIGKSQAAEQRAGAQ